MIEQNPHVEALHDIRRMMQRSSRFLSLSGLSGIAAGCCGLAGAYIASGWIAASSETSVQQLKWRLLLLAAGVLTAALLAAFYFTWRRVAKSGLPLWDHSAKMLTVNMMIPLVTGGLLILSMLQYNEWRFAAPLSLIFYGLALVNGSKYTLSDIRYVGLLEIAIGLINMQLITYSIYFWAIGFGVLHIIYGFMMWWKNERTLTSDDLLNSNY